MICIDYVSQTFNLFGLRFFLSLTIIAKLLFIRSYKSLLFQVFLITKRGDQPIIPIRESKRVSLKKAFFWSYPPPLTSSPNFDPKEGLILRVCILFYIARSRAIRATHKQTRMIQEPINTKKSQAYFGNKQHCPT